MTRLVGLQMQGIRSIGEEPHIINFLDPLTIIQGENGTGKTTTIEALNYITTGALPAGRLSSFIHNNKLSKKKRVDALVKLHFVDFRGNVCVATKRMCASQTGRSDKVTTKSDEFTLKITEPNGRTRSEAAKVSDFNKQIENLFGVPAAILQHVIFCHQEESTWPLGEPKELKTKFDAIFEVEKFVKVMDAIKKMAKEFENDLKVIRAELPHLQRHMQHLASVFMQLEENKRKVDEIKTFIREKEEQKSVKEKEVKVLRKELDNAVAVERAVEMRQTQVGVYKKMLAEKQEYIKDKPYNGTKEDLMKELEAIKSSSEFTEAAEQKRNAQSRKSQLEQEIPQLTMRQRTLQEQINKVESKRLMLDNLQNERSTLISESLDSFRMKVDPSEFIATLAEQINLTQTNLKNFEASKRSVRDDHTAKINKIREELTSHKSVDKLKSAECARLKEQIDRLEKELEKASNSGERIVVIQNEIAERTEEIRRLQTKRGDAIDALKTKLFDLDVFPNVSTEVDNIETLVSSFDNLVLANNNSFVEFIRETAGDKALMSENTRKDLDERKAQLQEAKTQMRQSLQAIQPLNGKLKEAEEALAKLNKNIEMERDALSKRIQKMQNVQDRLTRIDKQLMQHNADMGSMSVDECHQKMQEIETTIANARSEIERLVMTIAECDNQQRRIHDLEQHLQIFNARETVETMEKEISDALATLPRPSKVVHTEMQELAKLTLEMTNDMNKKLGSKQVLVQAEKDLRNQLKGEKIEDVKKNLKTKVIQRVSTETAIQDLKNLAKVMDDSIIQYHAQKMEQINGILCDLWPRVYQGNDIESIQIKSKPIEGTEKRKSYDYSVVMVVDQVEIEMRDRCSAGQKMLASILIRIALAEVFGGNCPVLALDEPTTNLDAVKVENMGIILKDLIEACRTRDHHHNLQLIVITHDKRLVEHLYTACRPDYVYGLSKDENGVSRIRMHRSIQGGEFEDEEDMDSQAH